MVRTIVVLVVVAVALGACGGGNEVDSLTGRTNRAGQQICDCYELLLYPSREACLVETTISPSEEACLQDVYQNNRAAAQPTISCVNDAYARFNRCLAPLDCGQIAALRACGDDFETELERCPQLPEAVADMVDECDINAWD